eukprot:TRINITY_DN20441_c0_g1_i1.p1 TRINITY_DN20441_c0_g1~~TRINITY_DN20441_c0_g1_i1.p1  ORF type:complete len:309 (+),score=75.48 TRINITY_DN20441_c0_g1_i1:102-1028(+)
MARGRKRRAMRLICLSVIFSVGLLCLAVALHVPKLRQQYDPIFQDLVCGRPKTAINGVDFEGISLKFHLEIAVRCHNPNPYTIRLESARTGKLTFAADNSLLGDVAVEPSSLAAQSESTVGIKAGVMLTGFSALSTITKLLRPADLHLELGFDAAVVPLPGVTFAMSVDKRCGVQVAVLEEAPKDSGDVICSKTFDGMQIPPISAKNATGTEGSAGGGTMRVGASKEELREAEEQRDFIFNALERGGYGFGALLLLWPTVAMLRRCLCPRRRKRDDLSESDDDEASDVADSASEDGGSEEGMLPRARD